jgi:hypothetical protein
MILGGLAVGALLVVVRSWRKCSKTGAMEEAERNLPMGAAWVVAICASMEGFSFRRDSSVR